MSSPSETLAPIECAEKVLLQELRRLHDRGVWSATAQDAPNFVQRFLTEAEGLGDRPVGVELNALFQGLSPRLSGVDFELVRLLFGLEPYSHLGPRQRHRNLPKIISGRTWATYRDSMFTGLLQRVLRALGHEEAPELRDHGDAGFGFYLDRLKHTYIEPTADSPLVSIIEERTLVATADELHEWSAISTLTYKSAVGVPICHFSGSSGHYKTTIEKLDGQDGQGFMVESQVEFEPALKRGERVTFTLTRTIAVDPVVYRTEGTWFTGFGSPVAIRNLELVVELDVRNLPSAVRRVSGSSPLTKLRPDLPESEVAILSPVPHVEVSWEKPRARRWYGIVWG